MRKFFCGPESFTPDLNPIVGQAKRYKNPIKTPNLRELFGSVELLRPGVTELQSSGGMFTSLKLADPIAYVFITSSWFTREFPRQVGSS